MVSGLSLMVFPPALEARNLLRTGLHHMLTM
jgi:hypothetical protein